MYWCFLTVWCSLVVPNNSDLSVCGVSQLKTPTTNPMFILLALHWLILFGSWMLSVNNNVVSLLWTFYFVLVMYLVVMYLVFNSCCCSSQSLQSITLASLYENKCPLFLFSLCVCSRLTEFREQFSNVCPSHTPSAFRTSTCCARGECLLLFFICVAAWKHLEKSAHFNEWS